MSIISGVPVRPLSRVRIEKIACQYLRLNMPEVLHGPVKLDIDALMEFHLQETHGFTLDLVAGFDDPKVEAKMLAYEKKIQITEACHSKLPVHGRSRFTACHECGHVLLHSDQLLEFALEPARMAQREMQIFENPEWQAEHCGGSLLMPLITVSALVEDLRLRRFTENEIAEEVAEVYAVSTAAAQARIKKISQTDLASLAYTLRQI